MLKVNVATLKAELSKYLEIAQKGEPVIVTSHGQEIAKLGPWQSVRTAPINWKEFARRHPVIVPKRQGTDAASLIRQLRDED